MTRVQKIQLAVRLMSAGVIIRFAYEETGIWTTVMLVLIVFAIESLTYLTRRNLGASFNQKSW